ncbi:acyl carrier protein [Dyella lipolytica]|uniref:Acyl carrier protein n=1 Tax=Dyella lipolytica TaxID=1867835 RepID=A0ABW8IYZ3_9GAMM|nr:acyl carrier protein [Dyella lipolytica]GLQ48016.1 acyl carrier protein [Dyella lipolytica]
MDRNQIHDKLTAIFRDVLDDDSIVLNDSTTADDVDGWDSLSHVNLLVAVEKRFAIRMSTREVKSMRNVGDFIALISQKLAQ